LRGQLERLALLDRTTRAIGSRQDPASILAVVARSLEEDFEIDFACSCLWDSVSNTLRVDTVGRHSAPIAAQLHMLPGTALQIDENGLSRCVKGHLVYEPDLSALQFAFPCHLSAAGLRSLVLSPLTIEGTVFGILVTARRGVQAFSSGECEFLRQLSEHLALALNQAELYSALHRAYEDLRRTQHHMMQEERLRVLGQMASGIAHDINNALSPAALYVQSMRDQDASLSERSKEQLAIVQRAIEDVASTVGRMREFYRREDSSSHHVPVDVNKAIEHVIVLTEARWNNMAQERGAVINVRAELSPDPPLIMGIESELRDALTNLILNAVDAMGEGGTLTLRSRVHERGKVCIEVIDTGAGMDESTRQRCLEPFFTTKGERGTGLGLAMVYGMVERHFGEIEVHSAVGSGTRVSLWFSAASAGQIAEMSGPHRAAAALRPQRVLIIDDDPLILTALREILEGDGHTVVSAESGEQGIATFLESQLQSLPFSVVITDLGMPQIDGRKVAAAIKSVSSVPVVLLTGWGHRMQDERIDHIDRVLSKPPKVTELRAVLAEPGEGG
jgi:signal transduction histidine kinase